MKEKVSLLCFAIKSGGFGSDICDPSSPGPASGASSAASSSQHCDVPFDSLMPQRSSIPAGNTFFPIILSARIKLTRKDSPKVRSYQARLVGRFFFLLALEKHSFALRPVSLSCTCLCCSRKNENDTKKSVGRTFESAAHREVAFKLWPIAR